MEYKIEKILYKLAKKSFLKNEVPIASIVLSKNNRLISKAFNNRLTKNNIFGHAEVVALKRASRKIGSWKLKDCKIITTFEPCMMCLGAITQSGIKDVIFMYDEPKFGFVNSNHTFDLSKINAKKINPENSNFNHRKLLRTFFINLRIKDKKYLKNNKKRELII